MIPSLCFAVHSGAHRLLWRSQAILGTFGQDSSGTFGLRLFVIYAPALLYLHLTRSNGVPWAGSSAGLLFYFVLMSQLADVLQWSWGQMAGRHVIAPEISSSRTGKGSLVDRYRPASRCVDSGGLPPLHHGKRRSCAS